MTRHETRMTDPAANQNDKFWFRHSRFSGFTVVELCLAIVITSLVAGALTAFSLAMLSAWKHAEQTQALTLTGNQVVLRIQNELRSARLIGACRAGSSDGSAPGAAVVLWKQDFNGDGKIQASEMEMIVHDTVNHELRLYRTGQPDPDPNQVWSYSTFSDASVFNLFATGRQSVLLARGVQGAVFQTSGTTGASQNPSLQFALKLKAENASMPGSPQQLVQYGVATVRAPLAQPN